MWFLNIFLQYGLIWISALFFPLILCNWIVNKIFKFIRNKKSMRGNIVVVTGAGSGIGRELACQLAQENCTIICVDKSSDANEETVEIIRKSGIIYGQKPQAISMVCDMTASESVQALAKNVFNNYGTVNILINNAGIAGFVGSITDTSTDQVNDVINVNLMTHFWSIKAFLPAMKAKNSGLIVAISSISALFPNGDLIAYSASKGGVTALMGALYHELRLEKSNVNTLTIHPGFTGTNMMPEKYRKPQIIEGIRISSPQEMASRIISAIKEGKRSVMIPYELNLVVYFMEYVIPEWIRHYMMQYAFNVGKYLKL